MSVKEQVIQELDRLTETELAEVATFLAFLKFRARIKSPSTDEAQLATLYAEFAEEDRGMAEEGMADYASLLKGYEAMAADSEREQAALDWIEIASDGG